MLWQFLIEATHGAWSIFKAVFFDTLPKLFYRCRGSTFNIFIIQPHTVSILFISGKYGGTACGEKADSISMPHSSTNMKVWGGALSPSAGTQKLTEVYEIYPELTGEVLAHDIHIIFLVYGSRNLRHMTKWLFFSAICTGIHGTKYNCVLQWMLINRDPKRAAIDHLTKGQSWTDFWVQMTLWTHLGPVWNKEATQNGFGPCGSPFHGNEEWHLPQQLWCNTNRQLSYNEKKQLHIMRRFGHFLRRLIRPRTRGEMVISTETDF